MISSMISSMIYDLIKLAQCRRRSQKVSAPQGTSLQIPPSSQKFSTRTKKEARCDSDESLASTEPGDTTNNDFSDKFRQVDASTDRSSQQGMHATKIMSIPQRNATVRPPRQNL